MSFDVVVAFDALCCYVPDKSLGNLAAPPTRVDVVLPDMSDGGLIGTFPVDKHEPVLAVEHAGKQSSFWNIRRSALAFKFTATGGTPAFEVLQSPAGGLYGLDKIPSLAQIAPSYSKINNAALSGKAAGLIAGRIACEGHGVFGSEIDGATKPIYFRHGSAYNKPADARVFAIRCLWKIAALTACDIVATDLDTGVVRTLSLPSSEPTCRVTIGNYCFSNLLPLVGGNAPVYDASPDSDFAAFYRLTDPAWPSDAHAPVPPVPTPPSIGSNTWKCHQSILTR